MKKSILLIFITGIIILLFSGNIVAQDSAGAKTKKGKVVLKIEKEDDGKTTVIDTVIYLSEPYKSEELEKTLQKYEVEMEKMQEELEKIEVLVDIPDFPDSLSSDSVMKHYKFIAKDISCPRFKWNTKPYGFDYKFDIPCPPDCLSHSFQELEDLDEYSVPGHDLRTYRFDDGLQTLSDLIGDIPMDRVKSYKIKDKKNGKQIIIDLNDGPVLQKKEKVIIIREPGRSSGKRNNSDRQVKVIIQSNDKNEIESQGEPSSPETPVPPVKKGTQEESAPKKSKI